MTETGSSTVEQVRRLTKKTQTQMAAALGMSLRQVQAIEADPQNERQLHRLAADRISLGAAVADSDPMKATGVVRDLSLRLAATIRGVYDTAGSRQLIDDGLHEALLQYHEDGSPGAMGNIIRLFRLALAADPQLIPLLQKYCEEARIRQTRSRRPETGR